MGLLDLLEPEETIGRLWHRLVGDARAYPFYPDAAVSLAELQPVLGVFFRGLGGDHGVQFAAAASKRSSHRIGWRKRLGGDDERLDTARYDGETVSLPPRIGLFPERGLNRDLYLWLAAFFVHADEPAEMPPTDPLAADLEALGQINAAVDRTLTAFPALTDRYRRLCDAVLQARPARKLPKVERALEDLINALLRGQPFDAAGLAGRRAPTHYRPPLPVPVWGLPTPPRTPQSRRRDDEEELGGDGTDTDDRRRKATRKSLDQAEREDSLILNNMEKVLGLAEAIDINRGVDDDDEEDAKKAADDLDEIAVSPHKRRAATRLRLDLDLPPEADDGVNLTGRNLYPEWDYRKKAYRKDHCAVLSRPASEDGDDWTPDAETARRIERVRRQFEALRPKRVVLRRQVDGFDLDTDALVRSMSDLAASGAGSDGVYLSARNQARDLAVALLVDVSLSTDSWFDNRRVIDVEKEALSILAGGLGACGDDYGIFTFTSRRRDFVRVETVKDFDDSFGPAVRRRIAALKPGFYTRMGPALRFVRDRLDERPNRHRLILILTDGKPNDIDHYEGRYAVEDTRQAVHEARRAGIGVFGVTVDARSRDYIPHLFGRGAYHIVGHVAKLPAALPKIYRQLIR